MDPTRTSSTSPATGLAFENHSLPLAVLNPTEQEKADVLCKLELSKKSSGNPHRPWQNLQDGRCVKYDSSNYQARITEARIMDFVRLCTSIPVPQVYHVFKEGEIVYTVMEFLEGNNLADSYRVTSPEELQSIAAQLVDYIRQLRGLNICPSVSIGACDEPPFDNVYFRPLPWDTTPNNAALLSHPFESVAAFNAYWLARAKLDISLDDAEDNLIVLTHGDLVGRNILIKDGKIVGILDWETVGWYPAFWETMIIRRDTRWSKKWRAALEAVLGATSDVDQKYILLLDSSFKEPEGY